jgi:hypothetical protein
MIVRWLDDLSAVTAEAWNRLRAVDNPFNSYEFLRALETSASLSKRLGWQSQHLTLWQGEALVAALPCYRKGNSHGEFVFDWHIASAYQKAGIAYYPKLLCGIPYSPVACEKLLVGPQADGYVRKQALLSALLARVNAEALSSVHVNFLPDSEAATLARDPWLPRADIQFQWHNPGYRDFPDMLDQLRAKKRKNILQERAKASAHGLMIERHDANSLSETEWQAVHALYLKTFNEKGNVAGFTLEFFLSLRSLLPNALMVILARSKERIEAAAIFFKSSDSLFGRHYGSWQDFPALHFEICYYQALEFAIAAGLKRFEPGAQGEHKLARGFLPKRTRSWHYFAHPAFQTAVRRAFDEEWQRHRQVLEIYREHDPFRARDAV